MNPQNNNPAEELVGLSVDGGWHVTEKIAAGPSATGGNFSVGYLVEADGTGDFAIGETAFLKALDFSLALAEPDFARAQQHLLAAFNFERDIVQHCADRRMRYVNKGIDSGEVEIPGFNPLINRVAYIIFECADRDARAHLDAMATFDLAWALRSLHNVASGINQLHVGGVAHQDLKPSNVLVFDHDPSAARASESKVGDLGRAFRDGVAGPFDHLPIAGDWGHAPPELLYGQPLADVKQQRRACDMYHVGSLAMFLFTSASTTAAILTRLDPAWHPIAWAGTYNDALAYVRNAWNDGLDEVHRSLPADWPQADELVTIIRQMTDPDPRHRGNAKAANRYSLEPYVGKLDRLAQRAEIALRGMAG